VRRALRRRNRARRAHALFEPADASFAAGIFGLDRRSCRDTSLAVAPSEAMRSGSRSTRISRVTPPTRSTLPTPLTAVSSRITVRSTNHDSSVSLMFGDATLNVTTGLPAVVMREITGSRASAGRSARTPVTASRISSTASLMSRSKRN
jgi:hypothetical protein